MIHSQPSSSLASNLEPDYHSLKYFPFVCYLLTVTRNGPAQVSVQIFPNDVHCVRGDSILLVCIQERRDLCFVSFSCGDGLLKI